MVKIQHFTLIFIVLHILTNCDGQQGATFLEKFIVPYRIFRFVTFDLMRRDAASASRERALNQRHNLQSVEADTVKFPCDVSFGKSDTIPNSVNKLRPGDIQVIGALGDSLTAGFGLTAVNPLQAAYEERGKSFSIGGQSTWRRYLTLPNILKEFNPKLVGYALGPSLTVHTQSQFNVAEGGAISSDMPYMAKILVKRIKSDKRVDLKNDWKFITIMIGPNDFCSEMCYLRNPEDSLRMHEAQLKTTIRILKENLPRTILNIVPPPHIAFLLYRWDNPPPCNLMHGFLCTCLKSRSFERKRPLFSEIMTKWQNMELRIANDPEFDTEDFTVIAQPILMNFSFPKLADGKLDYSYLAGDCFHISQKAHARIAREMWNSMLEPVNGKHKTRPESETKFNCPTKEKPYIFTRRNSY